VEFDSPPAGAILITAALFALLVGYAGHVIGWW